jgi:hypothetical protein
MRVSPWGTQLKMKKAPMIGAWNEKSLDWRIPQTLKKSRAI